MSNSIVTGTFDPPTLGHLYLIDYASTHFDKVVVLILINENKTPFFSVEERKEFLTLCCNKFSNVKIDFYDGFAYEYIIKHKFDNIIRGYRNEVDLQYESAMAEYNKEKCGIETLIIETKENIKNISSSFAKENFANNEKLKTILPSEILEKFIKHNYSDN